MSKRRRRNSRRTKSSCSTKQIISSYSFRKNINNPLEFVATADRTAEKGAPDRFCEGIFLSDADSKDHESPSDDRKTCRRESGGCDRENAPQADEDSKLTITHSVTFNDLGKFPPKIVFQRSEEFKAGESGSIVIEVTTSDASCASCADLRLEISETLRSDRADIKTTLILQNETEKESTQISVEPCSWSRRRNDKMGENFSVKVTTEPKANYSSFSSRGEAGRCKSCRRPRGGEQTDSALMDGSSTRSSLGDFWLPRRWLSQPGHGAALDVTPSPRFAGHDALQDLTKNMTSCQINDQGGPQNVPVSSSVLHKTAYGPEISVLRSSSASSDQKRDSGSSSQSSRYVEERRKRRKTYPGVSYLSGHDGESRTSGRGSFSSTFFVHTFQSDLSGGSDNEKVHRMTTFNSQPNLSSFCGGHLSVSNGETYRSSASGKISEDVKERPADTIRLDHGSFPADPLEHNDVSESGFDEEVESPEALTEDGKNSLLPVTPPSGLSSEEGTGDGWHKGAKAQEKKRSSLVSAGYERRSPICDAISEDGVQNRQSATQPTSVERQKPRGDAAEDPKALPYRPARRTSSQLTTGFNQTDKRANKTAKVKEHRKAADGVPKESEDTSDRWAKKRKTFKESRQRGSAEESSVSSNITDESDTMNSEDTPSIDISIRDIEDRGFYTETFHSASWIYRGDDGNPNESIQCLSNRPRPVAIRERTVKISKGPGEYPWGFRIQYSKPIIVTEVDTNGAAEEAGLKVGDYVLAVNGTDVTGVPHSEAVDLARQGPDLLILTIGSDIGRTPNTPKPACRGYLHKRTQSSLLRGWRKRWFVLRHDCCLYYYRNKRDEGKSHALAVMRLEGAVVEADSSLGKPFVFRCSPAAGSRVYYFCATSNQEMRRWLEVLERAVHPITQNHVWVDVTRHNSNLPPLAVKNPECLGLLNLLDRNKDSWVQHYCILKDGCLYFYAGIRSTYAIGGIFLHGYTVREQPLGFRRNTIELKPPSEEFKVFYLCAENVNENKRWIGAIKTSIGKWLPLHLALQDYMSRPPEETKM